MAEISSSSAYSVRQPVFKGVTNPETKGLFIFDLDGTLAKGGRYSTSEIFKTVRQRNGFLVYATGRSKTLVESLQKRKQLLGIDFPTPDYLVTEDGKYIYENQGGKLKKIYDNKVTTKATAIEFLKSKLNIPFEEIIMSGNGLNDLSMVPLCGLGSSFVCVGNGHKSLKKLTEMYGQSGSNAYIADGKGAEGILEGFEKLLDMSA